MTGAVPAGAAAAPAGGAFRVRLGVALIAVSWLPVAQTWIWLASLSGTPAEEVRAAVWTAQVLLGLAGAAIAGRETVRVAKNVGWRRMPRTIWNLVRPGGGDRSSG